MRVHPPGPKGEPGLGNTRQFARDPLAFMEACRDAYGDLPWFSLGPSDGAFFLLSGLLRGGCCAPGLSDGL